MMVHIALACAGELTLEINQPTGDVGYYRDLLPATCCPFRHHHNGYRVDDTAHWQRLESTVPATPPIWE